MASSILPLQELKLSRAQLRDPQQGDARSHSIFGGMEALPRRRAPQLRDLDRPQKPGILHDYQEVESQTGTLVIVSVSIRVPVASSSRKKYGETRRAIKAS